MRKLIKILIITLNFIKAFAMKIVNCIIYLKKKFPLIYFISMRIVSMVLILFFLGLAVFGLIDLAPGDIVDNYVRTMMAMQGDFKSSNNIFSPEQIQAMKHRLGLDLPFYTQYLRWLKMVIIDKDLGTSLISKAPILFLIKDRLVNSLTLNVISLVFLTLFSFALGIYFSSKVGTKIDIIATFTALMLHSFPYILLLLILQFAASVTNLFPVTAYPHFTFEENPTKFVFSYTYHIFIPLLGAFLSGIGGTMRMLRATMLDQLGQPYITALRARGISEQKIYFNHAFRNTLNPYITSSADMLASLFSGSLVLEIVFSYPGIGRLMYEAVLQEDMYLVVTNVLFISFLILVGMIIADIALALVDPRIRYSNN